MSSFKLPVCVALAGFMLLAGGASFSDAAQKKRTIPLASVPQKVHKAAMNAVKGIVLSQDDVEVEVENGQTVYEFEGTLNGEAYEIEVSESGEVLEVERDDDDGEDDDKDDDDNDDKAAA